MTFEEAKILLGFCERAESRDHVFNDREIYWTYDGEDVAEGYFSWAGHAGVHILLPEEQSFSGQQAKELAKCGAIVNIGRNDETGPDAYWGA